jgi:hypothetical protein
MSGAIPHSPNKSSWRGALLKAQAQLYFLQRGVYFKKISHIYIPFIEVIFLTGFLDNLRMDLRGTGWLRIGTNSGLL